MSVRRSLTPGPFALLAAAASLGLAGGCLIINKEHCAYTGGGADNPCPADHVCSVCAVENNGCVPLSEMDTVPPTCLETLSTSTSESTTGPTAGTTGTTVAPTTGMSTTFGETSTTDPVVTETSSPSSSTTETTGSTSSGSSTGDLPCDPDALLEDPSCTDPMKPYCVAVGTCGPCEDLDMSGKSCADVDLEKPVCDPSTTGSGRCVQCTKADTSHCPADKPGCNTQTGSCAPCTEHSECPTTACDVEMGVCFPDDSIIFVENNTQICLAGTGTEMKPFCTLQDALPALVPGTPTTIKIRAGASAMKPLALANPGYILALVRVGNQTPILDGKVNAGPTVDVSMGSRVYLSRLRFNLAGGSSVLACANGTLYVDDVDVIGDGIKPAKALGATSCETVARRSVFRNNVGGLQIDKGSLRLENSYVSDNGTAAAAFGAFNFIGSPTVTITYSTVVRHKPTKSSTVFNCTGGDDKVTIRNSAFLNFGPVLQKNCVSFDISDMTMMQDLHLKSGVVVDANDQMMQESAWFSSTLDGRFKAAKEGPLKAVAQWVEGDPLFDFDGTDRPTMEPSYAGADEFPL